MSRTYRHRHKVQKGYKVVDRHRGEAIIAADGKEIYARDYSGDEIRWQRYYMEGQWDYGHGFQTNILEMWKLGWFAGQKIAVRHECIKRFTVFGRRHVYKELHHFESKARRRRVNMKVHCGEFDQLHLKAGPRGVPPKAYRKPRRKIRSEEVDYLEYVRPRQIIPNQTKEI